MADKLTDAQVKKLEAYKDAGDRYGYWNYLGNVVGVPYAKLALQVVTKQVGWAFAQCSR